MDMSDAWREKDERGAKICVNNGQLPFWLPPRVAHAKWLDQFSEIGCNQLRLCSLFSTVRVVEWRYYIILVNNQFSRLMWRFFVTLFNSMCDTVTQVKCWPSSSHSFFSTKLIQTKLNGCPTKKNLNDIQGSRSKTPNFICHHIIF